MRIRTGNIDWWYINLARRTDRLPHIKNQLRKAGIFGQRFNAYGPEDYRGSDEAIHLMRATPGTIGNFLSHTAVMDKGRYTDKVIGVLEDDALLCSDFQERLQYIEEKFDKDWDIFYLGATYHVNPPVWHKDDLGRDFELTDLKHIHRVYGAFSDQGYLVNGRSAGRIVDTLRHNMHLASGIDTLMIRFQPEWRCYSFTPGMVFQLDGYGDVGGGMTYFSDFKRSLGPHVYAERLEDFDYDSYEWAEGQLS